ncbi:MmpS family transport accessory protein [Micromonospora sp. DT47]|uniref:MmpS family transport accessory protein n=1 Tax=Micromonospora sp. DT47 TaxID=3393431 RepID=UPI003CE72F11
MAAAAAVMVLVLCGVIGAVSVLYRLPGGSDRADPVAEEPYGPEPGSSPGVVDFPAPTWTAVPEPEPTPTRHTAAPTATRPGRSIVVYEVTGRGSADIQFHDENGELVRFDAAPLPWRSRFRTDHPELAYVQATRREQTVGMLSCSLTVDGGRPVRESIDGGGLRTSCGG